MVDESLVTHFRFSGDTIDDISGTTASNNGATLANGRLDIADTGYFLDGTTWMSADLAALPLGSTPKTLSVWAKSADGQRDGNNDHIVNWGQAGTRAAFGVMIHLGDRWYSYAGNANLDSGIVADTDWHQLTFSYDGTTARFYVDGQFVRSAEWPLTTEAGPLLIGIRPDLNVDNTFDGTIDDVRIYDRALADGEVEDLYAWARKRDVETNAHIVRVEYGDLVTDLNFR